MSAMPKVRAFMPAATFAALAVVYGFTVCRAVGPADSAELTAALTSWGVPHAPGFPLLCLLGNLLTHLVGGDNPAFILNLANAGTAALACVVMGAAVTRITGSRAAGAIAALALGVSKQFWEQALVVEVFSLTALMAALSLSVLAHALEGSSRARRVDGLLAGLILVLSTALTHHPTLLLVGGPVTLVVVVVLFDRMRGRGPHGRGGGIAGDRRLALAVVAAAVAGLVPLLYLPLAARADPILSWGDIRTPGDVIGVLLRRDFGTGTLSSPAMVANVLLQHGESAKPLGLRNFTVFIAELPRSFGWCFVPLPLFGLAWSAKRCRPVAWLTVTFLLGLAAFFSRVNTPRLPLYQAVTERFYAVPHVFVAFLGGCGVAWLIARGGPRALRAPIAGIALAALIVLPPAATNWGRVDQRRNTFTEEFSRNLLAGVPPRAIFYSRGDLFHHGLLYQRVTRRARTDVTIVSQELLQFSWYARQVEKRGWIRLSAAAASAGGGGPRTRSLTWLDLEADAAGRPEGRPVVAVNFMDNSYQARYRLLPLGIWSRVLPKTQRVDLASWEEAYAAIVRRWEVGSLAAEYPAASWEGSEGVFYAYALGQLQGLRDLVSLCGGRPSATRVPALEVAARWTGRRRADFLAYRAEGLRLVLEDSLLDLPDSTRIAATDLAMREARASLAIDPDEIQALQTAAALMARSATRAAREAEYGLRRRIVALRPGDLEELIPYFKLALRSSRDVPIDDRSHLAEGRGVQARLLRVLDLAIEALPSPVFISLRRHWSAPLEEIPDLK